MRGPKAANPGGIGYGGVGASPRSTSAAARSMIRSAVASQSGSPVWRLSSARPMAAKQSA